MSVSSIEDERNRNAQPARWESWANAPRIAPPHNLQAEQALLGALLINNQASEHVTELSADHFYDPIHGQIFEAMSEALLAGRTFTATTLAERFRPVDVGGGMNGAQYLGRLMSEATTISNIREYARTVIEASQRRQLIVLAEDLVARAADPSDALTPPDLIEWAERSLFRAAAKGSQGKEIAYADAIASALKAANTARMSGGIRGVMTGFRDLDRKMGGLGNGNLIILAARPSMGKTALALNIAGNVAQSGDFVHFFSLEMTSEELGNRQLGEHAGVPSDRIRRGDFSEAEFIDIDRAARRLSGLPITIDETGGISIAALATKARRMKRRKDTKLIVVDYLQLMSAAGKGGNRVQDITEITTGLKALAKELDVPVIALSQLNRDLEKRPDKRPQLSDLRESGSIEQDADAVMFVYREQYYWERENPEPHAIDAIAHDAWEVRRRPVAGLAEVIIGKQRHGSIGTVKMAFDGARTRFDDLADGYGP